MTLFELAARGGARPNAMPYSMCIGGENLHHPTTSHEIQNHHHRSFAARTI